MTKFTPVNLNTIKKKLPQSNFIYQLVNYFLVFPLYHFLLKGYVIGNSNVPKCGAIIIVSNHGSDLDPPILGHVLGRPIAFMAKSELFSIPFLGSLIRACGAYPVRRGGNDREAIRTAKARLNKGWAIGIFPDGTRQFNGRINEPQLGAALLSNSGAVPMLPVGIVNNHRAMGRNQYLLRLVPIQICIGHPIAPPPSRRRKDLEMATLACQEQINMLLDQGVISNSRRIH
uniref:1-acyl-sn-glycerol-3-phosphate acyltransferase n=1 Tax=Paulinella chromatophora TaxID=39717 RepID=B1X482_PAUCH|nr:1-acyl-sn-glycerol-3-phosphate acyltransferase [Paulinella chromatophora]ACB42751.1 1-acyl-sn-glycerol-3-phosphate acyltransferase [Paulinella chromatophora]